MASVTLYSRQISVSAAGQGAHGLLDEGEPAERAVGLPLVHPLAFEVVGVLTAL
jgi:hypothetical protein